jgi:hypothetical protein
VEEAWRERRYMRRGEGKREEQDGDGGLDVARGEHREWRVQ